jgi:thiol-disulfide isomerase/thioredoxin
MEKGLIRLVCIAMMAFSSVMIAGAGTEKPASLNLKDMQGSKVKLSDLRGKVVVLNFWATWCGPCDAEMPMLVKTAASYAGKNVAFIGASVDEEETQKKIAPYIQKRQITYPIWIGATDDDMKHLQLGNIVPATLFLDETGVVRARILGQMKPGEIEERVNWLLANQQGSAPPAIVKHLDEK